MFMSGESVLWRSRDAADYSPSVVLAGGGNPVVGFEAATATLRALYRRGSTRAQAAGLFIVSAFDDELRAAALHTAPKSLGCHEACAGELGEDYWQRWLAGVRDASLAVCDAYWGQFCGGGLAREPDNRLRLAVSLVEALKWSACDCCGPNEVLWSRLSSLLLESSEGGTAYIAGDMHGIGREYLRAFALHAAELERVPLSVACAVSHLVELCLPLVSLCQSAGKVVQYVASPATAPVPHRQLHPDGAAQWHFAPWAADELLAGFEVRLLSGDGPPVLDRVDSACYLEAVVHLRQAWSASPAVRNHQRYTTTGLLRVARGFEECCQCVRDGGLPLLRAWSARDVSYGGASATVSGRGGVPVPARGELLGVRFTDGDGWHLYVLRRYLVGLEEVTFGMQSLSRRVWACRLEHGSTSAEALLCDHVVQGAVVRLVVAAQNAPAGNCASLLRNGRRTGLRLVDARIGGRGFALCRYRVL